MAVEKMPTLPLEIIRKVFLHSADTRAKGALLPLVLVCREAHTWMTPLLYHSVHLTTADRICSIYDAFRYYHLDTSKPSKLSLVKNLWIGPTSGKYSEDLEYGATSWPITIIHGLLVLCTSLQSLNIINLSQNLWYRLENVIPASIESLSMGPIHGPLILGHLRQQPRIRNFTSGQSYMRDDEVQSLVQSPHLRRFRRIGLGSAYSSAVAQTECVSRSETLEEMQIILCGQERESEELRRIVEATLRSYTDDKRVVVTHHPEHDWISVLFDEFAVDYTSFMNTLLYD